MSVLGHVAAAGQIVELPKQEPDRISAQIQVIPSGGRSIWPSSRYRARAGGW